MIPTLIVVSWFGSGWGHWGRLLCLGTRIRWAWRVDLKPPCMSELWGIQHLGDWNLEKDDESIKTLPKLFHKLSILIHFSLICFTPKVTVTWLSHAECEGPRPQGIPSARICIYIYTYVYYIHGVLVIGQVWLIFIKKRAEGWRWPSVNTMTSQLIGR